MKSNVCILWDVDRYIVIVDSHSVITRKKYSAKSFKHGSVIGTSNIEFSEMIAFEELRYHSY